MKKLICSVLILTLSLPSWALQTSLFPLSLDQRYIENENQDLYFQKMDSSISAALTFSGYQLGLESTTRSSQSGAPLVRYKETFEEINSTHLFLMASVSPHLHLYSGVGLGLYESKLESEFNGTSSETKSGKILFASGIASAQFVYSFFHAVLDFRLLMGKDYRPQPMPSAVFKLGVTF